MNIEIDYLWSHKCPKKWDQYTLIALVITIIVLLILAGVTVATLTGENGLLSKAQLAKEKNIEAEYDERDKLSSYENKISNYGTWERTGGSGTITISEDEYNMLKNANSYSTDEKVIGTWADNKPLYQKVFFDVTEDTELLSNIDTVVEFKVSSHGTGTDANYHDIGDGFSAYSSKLYVLSSGVLKYSSWSNNVGEMLKDADFIIIQYTKTTDTAPSAQTGN